MLQFSLRNLLIAVTAVAVGTAALLNANEWWGGLLWGLAFLLLVFAGLVALYRRDAQRAFWIGCLVTSALYLFLIIFAERTSLPLITTKVTDWGYSLLPDSKKAQVISSPAPAGGMGATGGGAGMMSGMPSAPAAGGMMSGMGGMGMGATVNPSYIDRTDFLQVGHALWMLLLSWLSGTVAFCLYRTKKVDAVDPVISNINELKRILVRSAVRRHKNGGVEKNADLKRLWTDYVLGHWVDKLSRLREIRGLKMRD